MQFYSADIEMLMSGWNILYDLKEIVFRGHQEMARTRRPGVGKI
jgi:hypothetical protein